MLVASRDAFVGGQVLTMLLTKQDLHLRHKEQLEMNLPELCCGKCKCAHELVSEGMVHWK